MKFKKGLYSFGLCDEFQLGRTINDPMDCLTVGKMKVPEGLLGQNPIVSLGRFFLSFFSFNPSKQKPS